MIGARQGCPLSLLLLKVLVNAITQYISIRGIRIGKEIKLSLFSDNIVT